MEKLVKKEVAHNALCDMHTLLKDGCFRHYEDLYKYLVGFSLPQAKPERESFASLEEPSERKPYQLALRDLSTYFRALKKEMREIHGAGYPELRVNEYGHWTQVEFRPDDKDAQSYRELIKLYVPVEYDILPWVARQVFEFLFKRRAHFCYKFAHAIRKDNICIWVRRDEVDVVMDFLQSFEEELLPAPIFCPEYKHIGVTRELDSSFNEVIACTLFQYLSEVASPALADYIRYFRRA